MAATRPVYAFRSPPELRGERHRYPVVIVGAGPIGLAAARDLALHGIQSIVLDDDNTVSVGSRAICWAQRALEILDRLGCAEPMMARGVTWNTGKVFYGDDREPVFSFDLQPDREQAFPAFINLQQYYAEEDLVAVVDRTPLTEIRWRSRVVDVRPTPDAVEIDVETPEGPYTVTADYLIAADGSRSTLRAKLGLEFEGEVFQDHFLIADIRMRGEWPAERWFWFDPPFARGQSALLHKQPDDVWRLDFQLGWNIDREAELKPERVRERVRKMLGENASFELEWTSIYTFQCRRLDRFVHGRVIFAGDSAHLVSPFGARGANGGLQDVDNLAWKLALVLKDVAPPALLDSYDAERVYAAAENLLNSTRSTDFITPKSPISRTFRNAVLDLARREPSVRPFVNSGRLSRPSVLRDSPLNARDSDLDAPLVPGAPAVDAPIVCDGRRGWFLRELGNAFVVVVFDGAVAPDEASLRVPVPVRMLRVAREANGDALVDVTGRLHALVGGVPGACLLIRPDQHVAGMWHTADALRLRRAILRCIAKEEGDRG